MNRNDARAALEQFCSTVPSPTESGATRTLQYLHPIYTEDEQNERPATIQGWRAWVVEGTGGSQRIGVACLYLPVSHDTDLVFYWDGAEAAAELTIVRAAVEKWDKQSLFELWYCSSGSVVGIGALRLSTAQGTRWVAFDKGGSALLTTDFALVKSRTQPTTLPLLPP